MTLCAFRTERPHRAPKRALMLTQSRRLDRKCNRQFFLGVAGDASRKGERELPRKKKPIFCTSSHCFTSHKYVCQKAQVCKRAPCDITSGKSHASVKQLRTHAINNSHYGGGIVIIIYTASTRSESFHTSV